MTEILALDLGKFKTAVCSFDKDSGTDNEHIVDIVLIQKPDSEPSYCDLESSIAFSTQCCANVVKRYPRV